MAQCLMVAEVLEAPAQECVILAEGLGPRAVMGLKRMLRRLRFNVRVAGSVEDALAMLSRHEPQLLLAAGNEAGQRLFWRARRGGDGGQGAVCLALLRQGRPREVLETLMVGADECLVWPFPDYMLARRLARMQAFA